MLTEFVDLHASADITIPSLSSILKKCTELICQLIKVHTKHADCNGFNSEHKVFYWWLLWDDPLKNKPHVLGSRLRKINFCKEVVKRWRSINYFIQIWRWLNNNLYGWWLRKISGTVDCCVNVTLRSAFECRLFQIGRDGTHNLLGVRDGGVDILINNSMFWSPWVDSNAVFVRITSFKISVIWSKSWEGNKVRVSVSMSPLLDKFWSWWAKCNAALLCDVDGSELKKFDLSVKH